MKTDFPIPSNPMFGAKPFSAPNIKLDVGGADRDRTGGLLVANQALSQLSYSPNGQLFSGSS
jgi:hypothetical protein